MVIRRQKGKGWTCVRGRKFWECSRPVKEFLGNVSSGEMSVKTPPVGPEHTESTGQGTFEPRLEGRK